MTLPGISHPVSIPDPSFTFGKRERRGEELAEIISRANEILAHCINYEETLEKIARLTTSSLATWCIIDIVTEKGKVQRVAVSHADPTKARLAEKIKKQYPAKPTATHGVYRVIQTGKSILIPEILDSEWGTRADDPEHLRIILELGSKSYMCVPLVARGHVVGSIIFLSSKRIYGQPDLAIAEELAQKFALAVDNARMFQTMREAIQMRDEFLSIAAHELRTPIAALNVQADLIGTILGKDRFTASDKKQVMTLLKISDNQAKHLCKIVNELFDVSKIAAKQMELVIGEVDLASLVKEVGSRCSGQVRQHHCTLDQAEENRVVGLWDRFRIEQVVTNLLSNAIKFGAGRPVRTFVSGTDTTAVLKVQDYGIGIDPADLHKIFERFERLKVKSNFPGLGLGLYISKEIVRHHGGTIRCESTPGLGSTFIVELPLQPRV